MARRELLMLAKVYNPHKHKVGGWYMSEKHDGGRAFWDGGLTRGLPTPQVPWASLINPKTMQPKNKIKPFCTGLWSRYGNPIIAPEWFLNSLPCCPLDGELWAGRGNFQKVMSTIRKDTPVDDEWKQIQYAVFGTPDLACFAADGEIKNANHVATLEGVMGWVAANCKDRIEDWIGLVGGPSFSSELAHLNEWVDNFSDVAFMIKQTKLPVCDHEAMNIALEKKAEIVLSGGEGVFLRDPRSVWTPKRVGTSLKVKGALDDEGTVVGFTSGRKTEKGSKLLGLIGALILNYNGHRLELSGLTNEEREFYHTTETDYARNHPGEDMPEDTQGAMFKLGDKVTFTYRELTDDGIPKEARYLRKRQ